VGYFNAGTIEFLLDARGEFFFMEMNTRVQVEHPVTEMVTGLDLVEWQLRVAAGEPLPAQAAALSLRGHAIEARVYAENPQAGFLPSTGTLKHLHVPEGAVAFAVGALPDAPTPAAVRVDAGVRQGDAISPHYDPMILKLIVWGQDREQALHRLREALAETRVVGVSTNLEFLKRVAASVPFSAPQLDTGLIARNLATLVPPPAPAPRQALALACASLLVAEEAAAAAELDPWAQPSGWRLNEEAVRTLRFAGETGPVEARVRYGRGGHVLATAEGEWPLQAQGEGEGLTVLLGTERVQGTVVADGHRLHVFQGGLHHVLEAYDPFAAGDVAAAGNLSAPMPGKLVALLVAPGAAVRKGAPLLVMEAMKMEHTVTAPADGTVKAFRFQPGQQVAEGASLVDFEAAAP
jgi:3-methylcrotonyl-CoA carboxylase alpha subunit